MRPASPDIEEEVTSDGAVVADDPRRGFDREKSFGMRTDDEVNRNPPTLAPLE